MRLYKCIFIVVLLLWVWPSAAQVRFGVRAGLARSSFVQKVDRDYNSGNRFGFSVAGLANIPFYRRFSFRPEVSLERQGGKYFTLRDEAGIPGLKYSSNYYTLQIPLNIAFNIPIAGVRMAIYGGPAPGFNLGGKLKIKELTGEQPVSSEKDMKTFNLGISSGISVEYKRVFFSIDSNFGLLDQRVDKYENESSVYHNNLTFSMGYMFR